MPRARDACLRLLVGEDFFRPGGTRRDCSGLNCVSPPHPQNPRGEVLIPSTPGCGCIWIQGFTKVSKAKWDH